MASKKQGLDLIVTDDNGDEVVFEARDAGVVDIRLWDRINESEASVELLPEDQEAIISFLRRR